MKILNCSTLQDMLFAGAKNLELNKEYIDSLNVYPVPDGDTGTNMSLTMATAIKSVQDIKIKNPQIDDLMKAYSNGALMGARGNSGVILSQIIKGMSEELSIAKEINTKVFAKALSNGASVAYEAVTKPKEGTILTVIRFVGEQATKIASRRTRFEPFLKAVIEKGNEILQRTPDLLPVLKKAGVVDAGGKGLMCILVGFYNHIAGIPMKDVGFSIQPEIKMPSLTHDNDSIIYSDGEIKFAYCTEYLIKNLKAKTTEEDINKLRDKLMSIGDCVICIGDLSLVKVHLHTNEPNRAMYWALQLGELDQIKIDNMRLQNEEIKGKKKNACEIDKEFLEQIPIALFAIAAGDGFHKLFKELMVQHVLEGGQSMNPSVDNIVSQIEKINSDKIIILPNNKNIMLAANQAKDLVKKEVYIVPSKNPAEGVIAAMQFDYELSFEENCENMTEVLKDIKTLQITKAVKTTEIDGIKIQKDDFIGLDNERILKANKDIRKVTVDLIKKVVKDLDDDVDLISIYTGSDATKGDTDFIIKTLEESFDDVEIAEYYGGQPYYNYYISVE